MRRLVLTTFILAFFVTMMSAQPADIIVTRNGDVYEGYISRQIPGKSLTIYSSKTTMTVSRLDAKVTRVVSEMLGDLPSEYLSLFPLLRDEDYVESADIIVTDKNGREIEFNNSAIIESGEDIKFVSFSPRTFDLNWSEVRTSSKVPYDFDSEFGIKDVLYLPSAERVEGQFMSQDLLVGNIKFRTDDGKVTVYKKSGVQALRFEPKDKTLGVWAQTPYCDKVILKDGSAVEGFIVSKIFGKSVTMMNYNTEISTDIPVSDIVAYEKYPNPMYEPIEPEEIVVVEPELRVNGSSEEMYPLYASSDKMTFFVPVPKDSISLQVRRGDKTVVVIKTNSRTSKLKIAFPNLTKERIFSVKGMKIKKTDTKYWPSFTADDIVHGVDVNFQSNDNEFIVADMIFMKAGIYVVYVDGSDRCFVINVKD